MLQQETLSEHDKQKIYSYFSNKEISKLLENQLKELYQSDISKQFMITISKQTLHLYINFHRVKALENSFAVQPQQYGCYGIKIGKSFPLVSGIRLHIFNNSYSPRLFDCRDVLFDVLGQPWKHTNSILDIFQNIDKFQIKLFGRNNQGLPMQMTGEFKLDDIFDIHELKKFSAMELFQDESRDNGALISTTQTHLLTLKQIPQKERQRQKIIYQLVRVCQLQCISQLYHNKKQKQIIVSLNKYRNIKSFDEAEKVSRKYKFQDTEQFIRNILKYIDRFQKTQTILELGSGWSKEDKIQKRLQLIKQLQQSLQQTTEETKKKQLLTQLTQQYQKIIQFFLSRAHSYYLVYVAKLNKIHSYSLSQKD